MDERFQRRYDLLTEVWSKLAGRMPYDATRVRINYDVLTEIVGSYFRYLQRFKDDQGIKWADRHKSGSFMMYWICRLKPVQILAFPEDSSAEPLREEELVANELFAIWVGVSCLNVPADLVRDFDFFDSLILRLRERECPPEFLSSMLYLYERTRLAEEALAKAKTTPSVP